jgi:uncharacterized membrane protein
MSLVQWEFLGDLLMVVGKLLVIILTALIGTEVVMPIYLHWVCSTYETVWETMVAYWSHDYRVVKQFIFGSNELNKKEGL